MTVSRDALLKTLSVVIAACNSSLMRSMRRPIAAGPVFTRVSACCDHERIDACANRSYWVPLGS